MYCKHCGEKIPKDSKFCRHCGNKIVGNRHKELSIAEEMTKSSTKLDYAGFWIRLGAYLIDYLVVGVGYIFVIGFVLGPIFGEGVWDLSNMVSSYLSFVIYNTLVLSIWSTTPGKHLYGLRILTKNKERLGFGSALGRSLLQPLSLLFFGVGYWNMNKNDKRQAWHDTKTGTIVVKEERRLVLAYILTAIAVIVWAYLYSLSEGQ